MDIMKPIVREKIPTGNQWLYEVKYDGFRCLLCWTKEKIQLISRNKKDLTGNFPEIITFCQAIETKISSILPIILDGELVVLNNRYQGNFSAMQTRARLKNITSIKQASVKRPAQLMVFDVLQLKGENLQTIPYEKRKKSLKELFDNIGETSDSPVRQVVAFHHWEPCWKLVFENKGEGIIAKRKQSLYIHGKAHQDWFKIKSWRVIHGVLTAYDQQNDYFTVKVYDNHVLKEIGKCKHGLDVTSRQTLKRFFITNGKQVNHTYELPPATCATIRTLDLYKHELREPEFKHIGLKMDPAECTVERLTYELAMLPETIDFSNIEKLYWPKAYLTKRDFLVYMREIAPYMLPFLKNHALTVIRCPEGVEEETFFQKHLPPYAPSFFERFRKDENELIICQSLDMLLWFANHGAIEYHIPFQTVNSPYPNEIVFDLDPPDRENFDLAIQAALMIKPLLDKLSLISFIKTSGNKGLQIHIPIPEGSMTYDETAVFTQAIAWTIEKQFPHLFTTERIKKKRNKRLYIDYVQHGKDKTLIAPYSPRKTDEATVATPLFWEEVNEDLRPEQFTIKNVIERVQILGDPFTNYADTRRKQHIEKMLHLIQD